MHTSLRIVFAAAIAALSLAASRTEAAPQILGLVASNGLPTPMRCDGSGCTALLASFCLQEARAAPEDGQAYAPGPRGGLTLVVTRAAGSRLAVPANGLISLKLYSELSTVQASLSLAKLAGAGVSLGAEDTVSLAVESETAIIPVVASGDPDPQTPEETELATGPLRKLAAEIFDASAGDTGAGSADSARLLGLVINALPASDDPEPIVLDSLLHQVLAGVAPGRFDAPTLAEAGQVLQNCQPFPSRLAQAYCLESLQSGLLATMNQDYWAAAGGS